jgi:hypothetical protein
MHTETYFQWMIDSRHPAGEMLAQSSRFENGDRKLGSVENKPDIWS